MLKFSFVLWNDILKIDFVTEVQAIQKQLWLTNNL